MSILYQRCLLLLLQRAVICCTKVSDWQSSRPPAAPLFVAGGPTRWWPPFVFLVLAPPRSGSRSDSVLGFKCLWVQDFTWEQLATGDLRRFPEDMRSYICKTPFRSWVTVISEFLSLPDYVVCATFLLCLVSVFMCDCCVHWPPLCQETRLPQLECLTLHPPPT